MNTEKEILKRLDLLEKQFKKSSSRIKIRNYILDIALFLFSLIALILAFIL